jgi:hypothetical protein
MKVRRNIASIPNVDILERLGLRVTVIRPREEVPVDSKRAANALADFLVALDRVRALGLAELEPLAELLEGFGDGDHL